MTGQERAFDSWFNPDDGKNYRDCWKAACEFTRKSMTAAPQPAVNDVAMPVPEGYLLVPITDLKELSNSINGDCYMGEDWEIKAIAAMLDAAPQPPAQAALAAMTAEIEPERIRAEERERCAQVVKQMTSRKRTIYGAINGEPVAACPIAAAIRGL